PNFEGIVDFKSIKQLEIRLKKSIEAICVEVMNKKETHNIKLRDNIIEYLNQNYHMYGLSLESIAIYYHLSVPYLSRFIKEQTEKTIKRYEFNLRMEKVEKQLIETDKPIKEIILSDGYKDVSNITRKFRKVKGIPPGQYRKLYRK